MKQLQIGFIGSGQMARALASGMVSAGIVPANQVLASDAYEAARCGFSEAVPGANTTNDNNQVVEKSDIVILAVKPQHISTVMSGLTGEKNKSLFVSIVAGATMATLSKGLQSDRIIRVMPNTPCLIGKGASAFCRGPAATDEDATNIVKILASVGYVTELAEPLLDAVTGLSGSGPAFIYQIVEALSDGGVRMGLPRNIATALAAHTVAGAAAMVSETGEHPAVLKDRVASPGGTTIAGLQALEAGGLRVALINAVESATMRSKELGQT
jgi:pyrroline-5-carboxylate reductase